MRYIELEIATLQGLLGRGLKESLVVIAVACLILSNTDGSIMEKKHTCITSNISQLE